MMGANAVMLGDDRPAQAFLLVREAPLNAPGAGEADPDDVRPFDPRTVRDQNGMLLVLAICGLALLFILIAWAVYGLVDGGRDRAETESRVAVSDRLDTESAPDVAIAPDASAVAAQPSVRAEAPPTEPAPAIAAPAPATPPAASSMTDDAAAAPAAAPAPVAPAEPAPGQWAVQLASIQAEPDAAAPEAAALWEKIVAAHPEIMAGARFGVQRADLGDRGVFTRVRATGFATKDAADQFCSDIKSVGRDCFTVRHETPAD